MIKEFSEFGNIVDAKIIRDKNGKSRGYGFVEFEETKDFLAAYTNGSGKNINRRNVYVDAEYGRTNDNFRPLRLGGGLGDTRRSIKHPYKR